MVGIDTKRNNIDLILFRKIRFWNSLFVRLSSNLKRNVIFPGSIVYTTKLKRLMPLRTKANAKQRS